MARIDLGGSRALFFGLCGLVGLAFVAVVISRGNEAQSRLSNEVRNTIADYYHAVVSAEKAQRAFILTEDADYLDDYRDAKNSIDESRRILTAVVGDSPVLSDDLITLFQLTDERNAQLDYVVMAYHALGFEAAVAEIRNNEVKNTSARIFQIVRSMVDQEGHALEAYQRRSDYLIYAALLFMVLSAGCGSWIAAAALKREFERRQALAHSNEELEHLVAERAKALDIERERVEELLEELSGYTTHNLTTISNWLTLKADSPEHKTTASEFANSEIAA